MKKNLEILVGKQIRQFRQEMGFTIVRSIGIASDTEHEPFGLEQRSFAS